MPSDRKMAISGYERSVAANQSSMAFSLRAARRASRAWCGRGLFATDERGRLDELEAAARVEAVDLFHGERAHQADRARVEHLARHHHRKSRRRGDHEARSAVAPA